TAAVAGELHASDERVRARGHRRRDLEERDREGNPRRRRQHHDVRLRRQGHDRHGRGGDQRGAGTARPAHVALSVEELGPALGEEGNTILPGIDDYPKKTEATYLADAQRLLTFAQANGINTL